MNLTSIREKERKEKSREKEKKIPGSDAKKS
jgi:hypothetical protein